MWEVLPAIANATNSVLPAPLLLCGPLSYYESVAHSRNNTQNIAIMDWFYKIAKRKIVFFWSWQFIIEIVHQCWKPREYYKCHVFTSNLRNFQGYLIITLIQNNWILKLSPLFILRKNLANLTQKMDSPFQVQRIIIHQVWQKSQFFPYFPNFVQLTKQKL